MGYTLIDYTKSFHALCKTLNLSAGTRSTFAAIIGEFNAARFPERLSIADRDLKSLAGLKSVASVHECKNVLKNHKLIDFTTKRGCRGVTEYSLPTEWLANIQPNINRTLTEHLPNISRTFGTASNIRVREDVKTKDKDNNDDGAGANVNEVDELIEYWEREVHGGRLTMEHLSELSLWLKQKGLAWVKEAMKTAADSNNNPRGVSFNYFKAVVNNRLNPKTKGGEKSASTGYQYQVPDESADDPDLLKWLDEKV